MEATVVLKRCIVLLLSNAEPLLDVAAAVSNRVPSPAERGPLLRSMRSRHSGSCPSEGQGGGGFFRSISLPKRLDHRRRHILGKTQRRLTAWLAVCTASPATSTSAIDEVRTRTIPRIARETSLDEHRTDVVIRKLRVRRGRDKRDRQERCGKEAGTHSRILDARLPSTCTRVTEPLVWLHRSVSICDLHHVPARCERSLPVM
jgi:hypothetical protein